MRASFSASSGWPSCGSTASSGEPQAAAPAVAQNSTSSSKCSGAARAAGPPPAPRPAPAPPAGRADPGTGRAARARRGAGRADRSAHGRSRRAPPGARCGRGRVHQDRGQAGHVGVRGRRRVLQRVEILEREAAGLGEGRSGAAASCQAPYSSAHVVLQVEPPHQRPDPAHAPVRRAGRVHPGDHGVGPSRRGETLQLRQGRGVAPGHAAEVGERRGLLVGQQAQGRPGVGAGPILLGGGVGQPGPGGAVGEALQRIGLDPRGQHLVEQAGGLGGALLDLGRGQQRGQLQAQGDVSRPVRRAEQRAGLLSIMIAPTRSPRRSCRRASSAWAAAASGSSSAWWVRRRSSRPAAGSSSAGSPLSRKAAALRRRQCARSLGPGPPEPLLEGLAVGTLQPVELSQSSPAAAALRPSRENSPLREASTSRPGQEQPAVLADPQRPLGGDPLLQVLAQPVEVHGPVPAPHRGRVGRRRLGLGDLEGVLEAAQLDRPEHRGKPRRRSRATTGAGRAGVEDRVAGVGRRQLLELAQVPVAVGGRGRGAVGRRPPGRARPASGRGHRRGTACRLARRRRRRPRRRRAATRRPRAAASRRRRPAAASAPRPRPASPRRCR